MTGNELNEREIERIRQLLPKMTDSCFADFVRHVNRLVLVQVLSLANSNKEAMTPKGVKTKLQSNRQHCQKAAKDALTPKELKTELQSIRQHYQKAAKGLRLLACRGVPPKLFDQHYLLGNKIQSKVRGEFGAEKNFEVAASNVEKETQRLVSALESFESDIVPVTGRKKAADYQYFIIEVAKFFRDKLPNSAISDSPNTNFFKVIRYLICNVLANRLKSKRHRSISDPSRHIMNALQEFRRQQS